MQSTNEIIGEIIAQRWQILTYLGEGRMSYVYKAQDVETGKVIVLKFIKSVIVNNIPDLDILDKQAKSFIALNHENIASYYDIHTCDQGLFLFCDYLSGESLSSLLSKAGKLPLDKCIKLITQITTGLQYAHERKILHGDLRPNNIYIVNDQFNTDEPKIVDFGFMHLLEHITHNNKLHISSTHLSFGDTSYMSPEQRSGQNIDERSDLYSLGCLMYELACGRPPFSSKSAMETTYKQKYQTLIELQQLLPAHSLLSRYQLMVNKLLCHNAKERYQSASLVEHDLKLLASAKLIDWQRKAYALKKPTYNMLTAYQWQLVLAAILLCFGIFIISILIPIIYPYCLPWKDQAFDNNKLWLVQVKYSEAPSATLLQQKDFLSKRLNEIAQTESKSSPAYIQSLFAFAQCLLACRQFNEALPKLNELQNSELAHKLLDPVELSTNISFAQFAVGDLAHAEQSAKMALDLSQDAKHIESKIVALKVLGDVYTEKNEIVSAERIYKQMYNLAKNNRLNNAAEYAYASASLADIWRRENKLKNSEQLYNESIDWGRNYVGHRQLFTAKACYGLALVYYKEGNLKAAALQLKQALPIASARLGSENNFVSSIKSLDDYILFHENIVAWLKAKIENKK